MCAFLTRRLASAQVPPSWSSYGVWPDRAKWNYDEEAANTAKARPPGLASTDIYAEGLRLWDISSDGKMAIHITDGMVTCANGTIGAPYLIKAVGGTKKQKSEAEGQELNYKLIPSDWLHLSSSVRLV